MHKKCIFPPKVYLHISSKASSFGDRMFVQSGSSRVLLKGVFLKAGKSGKAGLPNINLKGGVDRLFHPPFLSLVIIKVLRPFQTSKNTYQTTNDLILNLYLKVLNDCCNKLRLFLGQCIPTDVTCQIYQKQVPFLISLL